MAVFAVAVVIFLLGGLLTWGLAVALFAHALARPPRMTDGKAVYRLERLSPADLGMEFEDLKFEVSDAAAGGRSRFSIAAWWIPCGQSRKTVILLHGFADAKVGVIAWAGPWREMGYSILAVDLRAHGESAGRYCTAGYFEREDVSQVIDQIRARYPEKTAQVALFGVSLGAAVAAATAALREDISAVVLDSPYASYRDAVVVHANLLRQPAELVAPAALWVAEKITGAQFAEVSPRRLISTLTCPVLVIAGGNDPFFDPAKFALREPPVIFAEAGHLLAFTSAPGEYRRVLKDFLGANAKMRD